MVCLSVPERNNTGLDSNFINGKRSGYVDGIKVIEFNLIYSNHKSLLKRSYVFFIYSLLSILHVIRSDSEVVIATSTPLTISIPGILARLLLGKVFIFEVRDLWPELPKAMGLIKNPILISLLSLLEKFSYHSSDLCIGLAPGICHGIQKKGISTHNIKFIPNVSDLELFNQINPEINKKILLPKYDINLDYENAFISVFAGAHGLANGLDILIDTAIFLKKIKRNDIHIVLIGDGKLKPYLKKRSYLEGLKNCHFIDPIPKIELAKLLSNSVDAGLMILEDVPAFYNGTSPNKFFDYLASGIPIIINYPGWLSKLINEKKVGISVRPKSAKKLAEALINLANDRDKSKSMGERGRILAKEQYSVDELSKKFADNIENVYFSHNRRHKNYVSHLIYSSFKRLMDISFSIFLLLITLPLLMLTYLIIKFKLGSPVFYQQERPGYKCKIFKLIKFRSMSNEKDSKGNLLPDNKRLNNIGKFLRSTSIDELPTLINIIKGDMSFIGPRPLLKRYLELYSKEQIIRQNVKPGLSGLAQINGRNNQSWEERFEFDRFYVLKRNFLMDLKIFIFTILKVIKREGINNCEDLTMPEFKGN